ncbi:hypothetical protein TCON_2188 [Astathelohania contejeani]|uniref:Uncharacterized protein n=1 Tax=Astathelohania contejeani TaxID=164912 RepID=A0ABQ7HWP2_9MICR|nr:hypothetical protein TCON_2188 [Thelohania contejeani]
MHAKATRLFWYIDDLSKSLSDISNSQNDITYNMRRYTENNKYSEEGISNYFHQLNATKLVIEKNKSIILEQVNIIQGFLSKNNEVVKNAIVLLKKLNEKNMIRDEKIILSMDIIDLLSENFKNSNYIISNSKSIFFHFKNSIIILSKYFENVQEWKNHMCVSDESLCEKITKLKYFTKLLKKFLNILNKNEKTFFSGIVDVNLNCKYIYKNKICSKKNNEHEVNNLSISHMKPIAMEEYHKMGNYLSKLSHYENTENIKYIQKFYKFNDIYVLDYLK